MREGQGISHSKFAARHEDIFGKSDEPGEVQKRAGRRTLVVNAKGYRSDSKNMTSMAAGVAVHQIPEAQELFGHTGVKFDAQGDAVFKDAGVRRRYLRARGMVDFNDQCGGPSRPDDGEYGKVNEWLGGGTHGRSAF